MITLHETTDHVNDLTLLLLPLYNIYTALRTVQSQLSLLIINSELLTLLSSSRYRVHDMHASQPLGYHICGNGHPS
jgi:hypothetical protein